MKTLIFVTTILLAPGLLCGQGGVDPADAMKPLADQWITYSGDYSGKRFSALKQVNTSTVKHLSLEWVQNNITTSCGPTGVAPAAGGGGGFGGGGGGAAAPIIIGGLGTGDANTCGPARLGGGILFVDGLLYASSPDNVWAIDSRDGTILWHYYWKTRGGTSLATRGLGMWKNRIYFELHDDWMVCLDAKSGKEIWKKEISSFDAQYFSSNAPMVLGNHIIAGTGNDMDAPGFIKAYDPETGELQWTFYTTPQKKGDPGLETWASLDAAKHGGGTTWIPGAYDPETHLYIFGTGNPTPGYTTGRGEGDNLYTCSLVAVNVDTGKMAWYYQTSPHDTHDWDSTETPALADMPFNGKMRKLVITATRNGYFFVNDRLTGEHLVTTKFGLVNNWAEGLDAKGQPKRNPAKDATIAGSLVNNDVTNYWPPTFSPQTGLFYVLENNSLHISYLLDVDPRGSMGLGGIGGGANHSYGSFIVAIDYKTGKSVWRHELNGTGPGLLSTAGGVLFGNDGPNLLALDAATGKALWHSQIGQLSAPPETFMLDGKQRVLAATSGAIYMFVLN
jgi:alcohol dehydrogenase (cytochrome c)